MFLNNELAMIKTDTYVYYYVRQGFSDFLLNFAPTNNGRTVRLTI